MTNYKHSIIRRDLTTSSEELARNFTAQPKLSGGERIGMWAVLDTASQQASQVHWERLRRITPPTPQSGLIAVTFTLYPSLK